MKKKMENTQTKTNGRTSKSPFSAPCPRLFPATLRSSVPSFLLQFNHSYSFPKKPQKNSLLSPQCCLWISFFLSLQSLHSSQTSLQLLSNSSQTLLFLQSPHSSQTSLKTLRLLLKLSQTSL